MPVNIDDIVKLAREAGEKILEIYQTEDFNIDYKEDESPLTKADLASHSYIVASLSKLTPDIPILSEESKGIAYEYREHWQQFWLVDPLDGTKEFIKRNGEFTVNIALIEQQTPVMGVVHVPVQDLTYAADKGQAFKIEKGQKTAIQALTHISNPLKVVASRSHSGAETTLFLDNLSTDYKVDVVSKGSALKLCMVAEGAADLYPRIGPTMEWDTAAAHAIIEKAGGQISTLDGMPLHYNKRSLLNPFFIVASPAMATLWQQYLPKFTT